MNFKLFILLFCLWFSVDSYAQSKGKEKNGKKKEEPEKEKKLPENIEAFPKNFLIRPRYVYPKTWIDVKSRLFGSGDHFRYKSARPGMAGISIRIKKVAASFAMQLPETDINKNKYGETKYTDINFNIQGRILAWGLFYRDYKGFYLDDYKTFYPDREDSLGYPKTHKLRVIESGLNLGFNFNKNFSMNAAFAQSERQKKSAGSFLMMFSERYQLIVADSNFVPTTQTDLYPNLTRLKVGNYFTTIIALGMGYQFVIGKIHFTPVVLGGVGFQIQSYKQENRNYLRPGIPYYANAKAQVGYNGDHFFINAIYQTEFNTIPMKESRIRLFSNLFEVGVGFRF